MNDIKKGKECGVKKSILGAILCMALASFCVPAQAADELSTPQPAQAVQAEDPIGQFTGKYWVTSSPAGKEAYLYGIESAIAVENAISSKSAVKSAKSGKKPVYTLSPFEKGWMEAFKNTTRKEIMDEIDKWYAENPDKENRPVMGVIWHEIIKPRLGDANSK